MMFRNQFGGCHRYDQSAMNTLLLNYYNFNISQYLDTQGEDVHPTSPFCYVGKEVWVDRTDHKDLPLRRCKMKQHKLVNNNE